MFIKWKYVDHGWGDFEELEIPASYIENYRGTNMSSIVVSYLEERDMVPTWSERYSSLRIKWEKIDKPSKEHIDKKIKAAENNIKLYEDELIRLKILKNNG